jgi:collagen type I alpha
MRGGLDEFADPENTMDRAISPDGTIWNSGDIQPDGLLFPDFASFAPNSVTAWNVPASGDGSVAPASGATADQPASTMQSAAGIVSDTPNSAGTVVSSELISAGSFVSDETTFAPLDITPIFGASILSLTGIGGEPTASQVEAVVNAAINNYQTNYTSDVIAGTVINGSTINIVDVSVKFQYGTIDNTAMDPDSGASESFYNLTGFGNNSYADLYSALSDELPNLPATDPTDGHGEFLETAAQAQMLGLTAANTGVDGDVGFNSVANGITLDWNLSDQSISGEVGALGAAEHEISEVFGRTALLGEIKNSGTPFYSILDLYRFTASNTPALTAGTADYFSINSGTTALGYFNDQPEFGGDAGDWASSGAPHDVVADAYDAFITTGTAGTISNLDTTVLDSIGFRADSLSLGPRTLVWTGAQGTSFATAGNWSDITDGLDPAQTAPGAADTAEFLTNGGSVSGTGSVIALEFGGQAQWLLGASTTLTATGIAGVTVGVGGSGVVSLTGGATIISQGSTDIVSGTSPQPAGITVDGTRSTWTSDGKLVIGGAGLGTIGIVAGGTATAGNGMVIANTANASGSAVEVTGTGSRVNVAGLLDVGVAGTGALSIVNGATVTAGTLDAGNIISGVANINVSDANFTVTGSATVADDGTGVMSVLSGATFDAAELTIGSQGDSSGALVVSGDGSIVNVSGDLNVGTSLGTGDLTIGPGATVNALVVNLQGQVVLENGELDPTVNLINQGQTAGGSGTIAAGDIVDEGVIQAGGSKPSQKLLVVAGTILGGGPWTINGTAQPQANGGAGILQINAGGTLELTGPVSNAASTTFTDDVTPQSTYTVNDSVVEVNFEDATGVLKLDDIGGFAGTIVSFRKGDSFVITGGTLSNLGVTGGDTLTVSDSGNGGTDQIIFNSAISASGFNIVNNNTIQVACFARGTRIATETGLLAVEYLRVGDRMIADGGEVQPIVWIGQRTVNCRTHPRPETVWPVRIARGAFGDNVPVRDLCLSPDHAVFVDGVLVPVKLLVNDTSIRAKPADMVTYYHVELPRHDLLLAEGLRVESYLDTGDRSNFANGGGPVALHPNFTARIREAMGFAPLVVTGSQLSAIRLRLRDRASQQARNGRGSASDQFTTRKAATDRRSSRA